MFYTAIFSTVLAFLGLSLSVGAFQANECASIFLSPSTLSFVLDSADTSLPSTPPLSFIHRFRIVALVPRSATKLLYCSKFYARVSTTGPSHSEPRRGPLTPLIFLIVPESNRLRIIRGSKAASPLFG